MIQDEDESPWEQLGEKLQAKWGKRTRAERNGHAGSRSMKLHEIYGITEEEAEQALAEVERRSPPRIPDATIGLR